MDISKIIQLAKKWKTLTVIVLCAYAFITTCAVSVYHTEYKSASAKMHELQNTIKIMEKQAKTVKTEIVKAEKHHQGVQDESQKAKTEMSDTHVFNDTDATILRKHVQRINTRNHNSR